MSTVINIILILASIVLIIAVLMQEGNKQGLGAIGGAAETFMGKSKAKSAEGKLLLITKITAAVFVVLAILATWWNLRTFTVTYYDANGNEFYPAIGSTEANDAVYQAALAQNDISESELKNNIVTNTATFQRGEAITYAEVPAKTGYTGAWALAEKKDGKWVKTEGALPEKMGSSKINVIVDYAINSYTVTVNNPDQTEGAFTYTGDYGTTVDYSAYTAPEAKDGETLFYSTVENASENEIIWFRELPETVPAADATYYADYATGNFIEYYVTKTAAEGEESTDEYVEYYPLQMMSEQNVFLSAYQSGYAYDYQAAYDAFVEGLEEEKKDYYRVFAKEGTDLTSENVNIYVPDVPEGMVGVWETENGEELSGLMGTERIKLYAKFYPAGTVKLVDVKPEGDEEYVPAEEITLTGKVGSEVTADMLPTKEGYTVEWVDGNAPTVFGEEEATYSYSFVVAPEEEATEEETTEEPVETTEEATETTEAEQTEETTGDDNSDKE